tara:strand:- start:4210 stop:4821 length:612 start_codon:yes stop_codon:yes gene_type:complete
MNHPHEEIWTYDVSMSASAPAVVEPRESSVKRRREEARAKNREHARNTRVRKREYVEHLERTIEDLQAQKRQRIATPCAQCTAPLEPLTSHGIANSEDGLRLWMQTCSNEMVTVQQQLESSRAQTASLASSVQSLELIVKTLARQLCQLEEERRLVTRDIALLDGSVMALMQTHPPSRYAGGELVPLPFSIDNCEACLTPDAP